MPGGYRLRSREVPASTQTPDQPVPGAFSRMARVEDASDGEEGMTTLPSLSSSDYPEGPILRSYSDVAASRTPSPVPGGATSVPYSQRDPLDVYETESNGSRAVSPVNRHTIKVEGDDGLWTTVSHRKGRSGSPAEGIPLPATPDGSPGYQDMVRNMAHMTIADTMSRSSTGSLSPQAGPSRKGKTVDAREWGNVDIPENELDPEVQQRELDLYNDTSFSSEPNIYKVLTNDPEYDLEAEQSMLAHWQALKEARKMGKAMRAPSAVEALSAESPDETYHELVKEAPPHRGQQASMPVDALLPKKLTSRGGLSLPSLDKGKNVTFGYIPPAPPAEQIASTSYLSHALRDARGPSTERRGISGHAPSLSSGLIPPASFGGGDPCAHCCTNGHTATPSGSNSKIPKDDRPLMKPIKPSPYDGTRDPMVYHLFARQVTLYLASYRITVGGLPAAVSQFLKGRAYRYYLNTLSRNPEDWDLHGILVGLFNYCFPIDFRMRMRRKLKDFRQDNRAVRDYAQELEMLLDMVGTGDKEDRVQRLWDGFSGGIVQSLWDHKMSPFRNSWDEIIEEAEYIEAARNIGRDHDSHSTRNSNGSGSGSGGGSSNKSPRSRPGKADPRRDHRQPITKSSNSFPPRPSGNGNPPRRDNRSTSGLPRISEEKKSELKAAGKCYLCESPDHFSRNCPRNNKVASGSRGKPPGIPAYSMEPDFSAAEKLRALAESTSSIAEDGAELGAIHIGIDLPGCPHSLSVGRVTVTVEDQSIGNEDAPDPSSQSDRDSGSEDGLDSGVDPDEINASTGFSDIDDGPEWDDWSDDQDDGHSADLGYNLCERTPVVTPDLISDTELVPPIGRVFRDMGETVPLWDCLRLPMPSRYSHVRKSISHVSDPYAERAMELLARGLPHHSCNLSGLFDEPEFAVYSISNDAYLVMNEDEIMDAVLDIDLLREPNFDISAWYCTQWRAKQPRLGIWTGICTRCRSNNYEEFGDVLALTTARCLNEATNGIGFNSGQPRFDCLTTRDDMLLVGDNHLLISRHFPRRLLENPAFDVVNAYSISVYKSMTTGAWQIEDLDGELSGLFTPKDEASDDIYGWEGLELFGVQSGGRIKYESISAVQRNSAAPKDFKRLLPEPAVVVVQISGHPARALLDSGSLSDFMSAKLAHQLNLKVFELEKALPVQLAVQGSRAKVSLGCNAMMKYQSVAESRYFDIINLLNYDLILGTPFLFQHKVVLGLNPTTIVVGSSQALPIEGKRVRVLESRAADIFQDKLAEARAYLTDYASPICQEASDAPLPPMRAVNHTIPLKDPSKVYSWRPSKCPDAHRASWVEKRDAYLRSGRWKMTSARNTSPMMLLTKPGTGLNDVPARLRVVSDLRERNANTVKLTSPLPDMEGILRRVSRKKYRSLIDGKDAYEHIRVVPEHVERTAMTTPDGNMVSLVMQQGDCNAVATYQTLMNHIFGPYIGVFMDVYLDDVVIYSDTLEDHIKHCKVVIDVLKREKLYLSAAKLRFLNSEMKILGRIVDDDGIRMDPDKVTSVVSWKVPTNKELLRGFLGSVGYLADDIATVRIPMGILTALTGSEVAFKWEFTHQRAFDEIKRLVQDHRDHHRVPLDYSKAADPIWLITDGSIGGIAGVVSQGKTWKGGRIAAFFSAKLSSAQCNYPVHEIEMLAGVESMLRHRDILLGCHFTWITDHKGLTHLLTQRNLSGRQARWIEKISEFDFQVEYVPGVDNILADALSRLYSNDRAGTVRSSAEYTEHDDDDRMPPLLAALAISSPVFVGTEAMALQPGRPTRQQRIDASESPLVVESMATGVGDGVRLPIRSSARLLAKKEVLPAGGRVDTLVVVPRVKGSHSTTRKSAVKEVTATKVSERAAPRTRAPIPAPETGRPETSREFAKRIKRVVLHIGEQPQEGEGKEDSISPPTMTTDTVNQSFVQHISEATDGMDLQSELKGRYSEDRFFAVIEDNPTNYKNFHVIDKLIFIRDKGRDLLCIPDIRINGRSPREIAILHAHSLLAHLGASKTLNYLRDHVWWKTMVQDIQTYCESCMTCKRSKPNNKKPYGLLNSLSVPNTPWEGIGIDFVGPLPESKDRDASYDSITVIIDLLSGMVHLVPSRINYTAKQIAELIFSEVYKLHGVPKYIVSDRDVLFTSTFWTHLHKLIGSELRMSSAYHPESDGSTERANRTVTQMLRQCIGTSQKDWVSKLPSVEFAINLARSESTGYSPFFLNTGRMPRSMIWDNAQEDEYPAVRTYAQKVKHAIISAHDSIIAARVKQTRLANKKRRPSPFEERDLVYVSTKNMSLPKGLARKLIPKFIGPYSIIKDYGNNSYKLELPANLKRRGIHDVFHSSLLRIHEPNDDRLFPGRLDSQIAELEDRHGEWAIDRIVAHTGSGETSVFETLWKSGDRTWVPYSAVPNLGVVAEYLELQGVERIADLTQGTGKPPSDDPQIFLGCLDLGEVAPIREDQFSVSSPRSTTFTIPLTHTFGRRRDYFHTLYPHLPLHSSLSPAYLAILIMVVQSRPVDNGHIFGDPDSPGITLFFDHSTLLGCLRFDRALRNGEVDTTKNAVPASYDQLRICWSAAYPDDPCQLSRLNLASGELTIRGRTIPFERLVPETAQANINTPRDDANTLTDFQRRTVDDLLWLQARNAIRTDKRIDASKQRRLDTKKAKASEKRAAGFAAKGRKDRNTPATTTAASGSSVTLDHHGNPAMDTDVAMSGPEATTHPREEREDERLIDPEEIDEPFSTDQGGKGKGKAKGTRKDGKK